MFLQFLVYKSILFSLFAGAPVGTFSAPLKQVARYMKDNVYQHNYANDLVWLDLSTTETMVKNPELGMPFGSVCRHYCLEYYIKIILSIRVCKECLGLLGSQIAEDKMQ